MQAAQSQFASDLFLTRAYTTVMAQAVKDGLSFVRCELQDAGLSLLETRDKNGAAGLEAEIEDVLTLSLSSLPEEGKV